MRKRLLCCLFVICLLTNLLVGFAALAADKVSTGTVVGIDANSKLYVRESPSTSAKVLDKLVNGNKVTIHDTVVAGGITWYKITTHNNINGYSSSAYIELDVNYETNADFEAHLTAQGFPEDYKAALRKIHAQYPNWIFRAEHLPMTWAAAHTAESKVGLNVISGTAYDEIAGKYIATPDSWKSMAYGAYSWTSGTYTVYDTGGWVTVAPSLLAYYMDPRNWLNSTYIFQFEDLSYSAAQTVAGVQAILPTALDKYAEDVLKASKETKVSAYFLATRMTQEGSHVNGLGTGQYDCYNFFNYGAYAVYENGVEVLSAVENGVLYAKNHGWTTPYKCLVDSANNIGKGYINLGQDTLYYQKFNFTNTTSGLYAHQYMSNVAAPSSEGRIRRNAASADQLATNLSFTIPVFKSMPETAAPQPTKTGNNNNFLDSITVEGHTLTPTFSRYTTAYSLHVGEATSITVSAKLNNGAAKLTGAGTIQLYKGDNVIPLTVTATSGETRTYTLTVTTDGGVLRPDAPVITGTTYTVTDTVTKVEPETTIADFIKKLAVTNGTAAVYTADGQAKTAGIIGTGDILRLYSDKTLCASYPVLIYGDVNGDGKVSSLDLRIAQKHILKVDTIDGYYLTAADSSKDGTLTSLDLRVTQKYILKITDTLQ